VERNWRYKKAEIDIIARKNEVLAIVEVKTRSSDYFGDPQDFVNTKKIKMLVEAVNEYVNSKDLEVEVRFDIIAIIINENKLTIEHLEDAFFHF
jgi:putative endonuclease